MISEKTHWIWLNNKPPKHLVVAARGSFTHTAGNVSLTIGADNRYQLYVNGAFVGHGPVRSFASNTRLDTYDITPYVRRGKNVVAVQVISHGCSTFQSVMQRGGLIAEVKSKDKVICRTGDKSWKMAVNPAYGTNVPRISCQQGWTEVFDARKDLVNWMNPEYNDSKWEKPDIVKDAPWTTLSERDIPFLTYKPEYPLRVRSLRSVRPPKHAMGFDMQPYFLPGDTMDNPYVHDGIIALGFECSRNMVVKIAPIHYGYPAIKIDNEPADFDTLRKGIKLSAGKHIAAFNCYKARPEDNSGKWHENGFNVMLDYDKGSLKFANPVDGSDMPFAVAAPYHSEEIPADSTWAVTFDDKEFFEDWADVSAEGIKANSRFKAVEYKDFYPENVYTDSTEAEELVLEAKTADIESLCTASEDVALIYPSKHDTEVTLDFGQIRSGFLEFDICAPEGVVFDFYAYEFISGDTIRNSFAANDTFRYTTRKGWQRHRSPIRRGMRYGVLTFRFPKGAKDPVKVKMFRVNESLFPYTQKGKFLCSDYVLNEIHRMSLNTIRLCSEDTYVDCPTYEQTFWVGDSDTESLFTYYAFGEYRLSRRCFRLAAESLKRSPMVESQVPSGWVNIIPAWSLMWSIGCYEYYLYTGDKDFLEEIYPAVKLQCDNIDKLYINKDGLFDIAAWNLFDWAPMDTPDSGVVTHQNMLLIMALRKAAECARFLGKDDDGAELDKRAEELKKAVNKHLKNNRRKVYIDSIHSDGVRSKVVSRQVQTLAYLSDVIRPSEKSVFERYIENREKGFVDICTPFAMTFVIQALLMAGKPEAAVKITRESWKIMTDMDTSTCWELLMNSNITNIESRSFCHAWSATPAYSLPAAVFGIVPIEPGFAKFEVKPCLETLDWAKGIVPTPHGEIVINAKKEDDKLCVELTVPKDTCAVIEGSELYEGVYDITLE
ncbi:MAG: alpha-L-rhamnosidase N-terminal domain-containing protein [Abditibacteriota bacterium]|nr:alpha-L-rhamnosidase N-terminal domain-containing protein [Abditibacteriota bacterium]